MDEEILFTAGYCVIGILTFIISGCCLDLFNDERDDYLRRIQNTNRTRGVWLTNSNSDPIWIMD